MTKEVIASLTQIGFDDPEIIVHKTHQRDRALVAMTVNFIYKEQLILTRKYFISWISFGKKSSLTKTKLFEIVRDGEKIMERIKKIKERGKKND